MSTEITIALTGLFCTIVTSVVTFMLTKKKYNTEVDSQQIQNMDQSFQVYKKIMEESLKLQDEKIMALQKENDNLKLQINQLQNQVFELMKIKFGNTESPRIKNKKNHEDTGR